MPTIEAYSFALLLVRVILGVVMIAHGSQKVLGWFGGHGLEGSKGFFVNVLKIPAFWFYVAAFTELLGGIAIVVGLFTRIAALGIAIAMLVAIFKVHRSVGFFMNWGNTADRGEGFEFSLTLAVISAALVVAGSGQYSLEWLLTR